MPVHDWTRVEAGIFHHFHHEWISTISRSLNAGRLPRDYYALAEQVAGGLGPDVLTLGSLGSASDHADFVDSGGGNGNGVALATAPPKVRFTATAATDRYWRKRNRVAIRHTSGDRVVAIVEIISPGNKASLHALRSFVEKAVELLDAGVHLLVIDLFPPGPRDPEGIHGAVWSDIEGDDFELPKNQPLTLVAYSAGDMKQAFIEPVAIRQDLPDMPLFLEPERYVPVPLEATYRAAFEAVPRRWQVELDPHGSDR